MIKRTLGLQPVGVVLLALVVSLHSAGPIGAQTITGAPWRSIATPEIARQLSANWIEIDAPSGHKLAAAVFTPEGAGPFPVVVLLHASGGFALFSARLGEEFARAGFLTVAACWFTGVSPNDPPLLPLLPCPNGPPFHGATLFELPYVDAIVKAARTLPKARGNRIGLIGQSRGATMAVLYASNGGTVQAIVADSGSYTLRSPIDTAAIHTVQDLAAPLLILQGTNDQTVPISEPREYEAALVRLGKPYEVKYYEKSQHVLTRRNNEYYGDAVARSVAFFHEQLGR